jgi:hypothetical protein
VGAVGCRLGDIGGVVAGLVAGVSGVAGNLGMAGVPGSNQDGMRGQALPGPVFLAEVPICLLLFLGGCR